MRCLTLSVGLCLLCFGPIQAWEAPVEPDQAATPPPRGPARLGSMAPSRQRGLDHPGRAGGEGGKQIPLTALAAELRVSWRP